MNSLLRFSYKIVLIFVLTLVVVGIAIAKNSFIEHASLLTIKKVKNGHLVKIRNSNKDKEVWSSYLLTTKTSEKGSNIVVVPVRRILALSGTYVTMLDELHSLDTLVGVESIKYVTNKKVRELYKSGAIGEVGYPLNFEKAVVIKPDTILAYDVTGSQSELFSRLNKYSMRTIVMKEYLENSPLGRAEWIKLVGILIGKEQESVQIFNSIKKRYKSLQLKVKNNIKSIPLVGVGESMGNAWYAPGASSNFIKVITAAGGEYIWNCRPGVGQIAMNSEASFSRMKLTDFWLTNNRWSSISELLLADRRYVTLRPVTLKKVYNNNSGISDKSGGYSFWERAFVRPDILLQDLVEIFHPEIIDHKLVWYHKLK